MQNCIVAGKTNSVFFYKFRTAVCITIYNQTIFIFYLMRFVEFVTLMANPEELKLQSFINNNSNISVST